MRFAEHKHQAEKHADSHLATLSQGFHCHCCRRPSEFGVRGFSLTLDAFALVDGALGGKRGGRGAALLDLAEVREIASWRAVSGRDAAGETATAGVDFG